MPSKFQMFLQLAEGLRYIHSKNIVHFDVKLNNVLVSGRRKAVLKWADFGLSKILNDVDKSKALSHSAAGEIRGWRAPEWVKCKYDATISNAFTCDVFPLGCIFFFVVAPRSHPFGDNFKDIDDNMSTGTPRNLLASGLNSCIDLHQSK